MLCYKKLFCFSEPACIENECIYIDIFLSRKYFEYKGYINKGTFSNLSYR